MKIMKRIIAAVALAACILGAMPVHADSGLRFQGVSAGPTSMTAMVENGSATSVGYMVYDKHSLVYEGIVPYLGGDVTLDVPAQYLRSGKYKVSVWGIGGGSDGKIYSFDVNAGGWDGVLSPQLWPSGGQIERQFMAAIKTPQATVYSDMGMLSQKSSLKKHDRLFFMGTTNPLIYYVFGYLVTGDSIQTTPSSGGYEKVANTEWYDGYVWANTIQSTLFDEGVQKEFVELAYTRLGLDGIYSQNTGDPLTGRWGLHSQDCSSFIWWVCKEYGVRMGGFTADSETAWLKLMGLAVADLTDSVKELVDSENVASYIGEDYAPYFDSAKYYRYTSPVSATAAAAAVIRLRSGGDINFEDMAIVSTFYEAAAVRYDSIDPGAVAALQPGDAIFFNHYEDTVVMIKCMVPDGFGVKYPVYFYFGVQAQIVEEGSAYGVDHTGMDVGNRKYIHASGKGSNTIISDLTLEKLNSVVFMGRPAELAT